MNRLPSTLKILKALGNEKRLLILQWILDPVENFPPQKDGDLVEDGVCVNFITQKIGLKQPTVTSHMKILSDAGLVSSQNVKNWVFYKPERKNIERALQRIGSDLNI